MSPESRVNLENEIINSTYEIPEDRAAKLLEQGADANVAANYELMRGLQNPAIGEKTSIDSPVAQEAIDQAVVKAQTAVNLGETATHEDWDEDRLKAVQDSLK